MIVRCKDRRQNPCTPSPAHTHTSTLGLQVRVNVCKDRFLCNNNCVRESESDGADPLDFALGDGLTLLFSTALIGSPVDERWQKTKDTVAIDGAVLKTGSPTGFCVIPRSSAGALACTKNGDRSEVSPITSNPDLFWSSFHL